MSPGTIFFLPALLLLIATLIKVWALLKNWQDTLLRAVCAVLFIAALVFATAAPPVLALINEVTGVPNIAAPLVYCVLTAFGGSSIVLLIHWRGGEDEARTRRATRLTVAAYGAVMAALCALFALGDAPVERLRDLDTYYANTPYIREMIVLYLVAHSVAALTMLVLCWRWSRKVPGTLRAGLLTMAAGNVLTFSYDLLKYTAIAARWLGGNLDWLSTQVAFVMASVSALVVAAGFLIPPVGQGATSRLKALRRYRRLRPLWLEVKAAIPETVQAPLRWWAPMELRLMQIERDIHDALLRIGPCCDRELGTLVYGQAMERYADHKRALIVADAAVVAAAVVAKTGGGAGGSREPAARWAVSSTGNTADLMSMSLALAHPLVQATRQAAVPEGSRVL
ncbi:MAB_1171c family putative transporter [Streptomyces sp. NPDC001674]|uniref:MAB_1171c family putative transporter n=1 Tax=Streptomyces sp. NPDC001674 TaxID=3154394 RepID=UPI0033280BDF